jgi:hypothetical protein
MRLRLVMTALVLLPSVGLAQQDMGVITGLVVDASGAVLPGVAVTAREQSTGVAVTATTNATGLFVIASLKIGTYTVEAELAGFKKAVARGVGLHAGDRARADFKLELGALAEEVSVVLDTPLLRTESSSLSHVVKDIEMRELPIAGRNFQNLATLAAGVLPAIGHRDREGDSTRTASGRRRTISSSTASTTTRRSWVCRIARRRCSFPASMPCRSSRSRRATIRPSTAVTRAR